MSAAPTVTPLSRASCPAEQGLLMVSTNSTRLSACRTGWMRAAISRAKGPVSVLMPASTCPIEAQHEPPHPSSCDRRRAMNDPPAGVAWMSLPLEDADRTGGETLDPAGIAANVPIAAAAERRPIHRILGQPLRTRPVIGAEQPEAYPVAMKAAASVMVEKFESKLDPTESAESGEQADQACHVGSQQRAAGAGRRHRRVQEFGDPATHVDRTDLDSVLERKRLTSDPGRVIGKGGRKAPDPECKIDAAAVDRCKAGRLGRHNDGGTVPFRALIGIPGLTQSGHLEGGCVRRHHL